MFLIRWMGGVARKLCESCHNEAASLSVKFEYDGRRHIMVVCYGCAP